MKRISLFKFSTLIVLVALLLQGCAASALPSNYVQPISGGGVPVRPDTVIYGISQALADKPGVAVFQNAENQSQYIIVWYNSYGASFFGADVNKYKSLNDMRYLIKDGGTLINAKNADEFLKFLKDGGWRAIPGAALPQIFYDIVASMQLPPWIIAGKTTISMPLFMFAVLVDPAYCDAGFMSDLMKSIICQNTEDNKT